MSKSDCTIYDRQIRSMVYLEFITESLSGALELDFMLFLDGTGKAEHSIPRAAGILILASIYFRVPFLFDIKLF
jgi:hypothetical protein